ncbi:CotH kinase family protein [Crocinitomix catalasitica]|nr:CotH kinase family protein [Crocinitomix catalasitica]
MRQLLTAITFCISISLFGQEPPRLDFEPKGGPHHGPVSVQLMGDEGAKIYYTLDGSRPNSGSRRYRNPIKFDTSFVIRAISYLDGKRSEVKTQSYFCDHEYTLPIVSIATHPGNLWNFESGIYVKGCCADTIEPYLGANYWKNWEYRANIEMYLADGEVCFNQIVGINIFGGFSRWLPQKSIAIFARSRYGNKRIEYPIFQEKNIKKYKSFIIRNSGGDFKRTHFRDAFMTQLAAPTGVAIQAYQPVVVYLNGRYWGIQNLREKISEHYLKSNFGTDKNNVDILRHNGVVRHGTSRNYKKLLAFLRSHNTNSDEVIAELRTFMNIEDYIRFNIAEIYSDNRDAGGNIRFWRERSDSAQWRWVFYDLDLGLGNNAPNGYKRNTLHKFTNANKEMWPDPTWSTFIIRKLLDNKEVEIQYINTMADHLNTVYHKDTALRLLDSMQNVVRGEMKYHVKRWGTSMKNWEHHVSIVRHFVSVRPHYLRKHMLSKFDLKDTSYVSVVYPGKEKAKVKFNSLNIKRDFKGIYFDGVPVTITVEPEHDYNFVGWNGRKEKDANISVMLKDDIVFYPILAPKKRSAFTDSVIFNELKVYQSESDSSHDWVELYNSSSKSIDMGKWGFTNDKYKDSFIIPEGTVIGPDSYLIICRSRENFVSIYPSDTISLAGDLEFGLSRTAEHIKLYDSEGFIVDSLSYYFGIEEADSAFTYSLVHPDSSRSSTTAWILESPTPGGMSESYHQHLVDEENRRYWTRIYYIGGGSFFFILVAGMLFYRYSRRHSSNK